jgi:hypothetical protein
MDGDYVELLVALLGVHALVKFAFFFVLPYRRRRAALDRAYGDRPTATRVSDRVLMGIAIGLAALLLRRGAEPVGLLGGFWIGATLVQLYFHRFHEPLTPEEAPPPVVSPIKTMSYAIQAAPGRPWRELLVMTALVVWALVRIVGS